MTLPPNDKEAVELKSINDFSVSFQNYTEYFQDTEIQRLLAEKIANIRNHLHVSKKAVGSAICRQVIVTATYNDIVYRWQDLLGLPRLVSTDENAISTGKCFSWGDDSAENAFSVIVLHEWIAQGLFDEILEAHASGIIAHEFGHSHDDFFQRQFFGNRKVPLGTDWSGIKRSVALNMWSEYFAEKVASEYFSETQLDIQIGLLVSLISASIQKLGEASEKYRLTNMRELWRIILSEISKITNQLGRTLGLVSGFEEKTQQEFCTKLYNDMTEISEKWEALSRQTYAALSDFETTNWELSDIFNGIDSSVELVFHTLNIYPQVTNGQLALDIRY